MQGVLCLLGVFVHEGNTSGVDLLTSHPFAVLPLPLLRWSAGDPLVHFTNIYGTGTTPDTEDVAVDFFFFF